MNNLRQISLILYRLKRSYGIPAKIRKIMSDTTDLKTGSVGRAYYTINIARMIVLPEKAIPSFVYDIAYLAANKNFTYGGIFGSSTRLVIVDTKDIPLDFKISEDDEVIFNNKVHAVKQITDTASKKGYILTITAVTSSGKIDE